MSKRPASEAEPPTVLKHVEAVFPGCQTAGPLRNKLKAFNKPLPSLLSLFMDVGSNAMVVLLQHSARCTSSLRGPANCPNSGYFLGAWVGVWLFEPASPNLVVLGWRLRLSGLWGAPRVSAEVDGVFAMSFLRAYR